MKVKAVKQPPTSAAVRASISFPEVYETLEIIAKENKGSLASVVREAAERYIDQKRSLFSPKKAGQQ